MTVKRFLSFLLSILLVFACCLSVSAQTAQPDRLVSETEHHLFGALYRAQGVATDGEYLYFGSNQFVFQCSDILKTSFAGDAVNVNPDAIPFEAKMDQCFHVGGIDYHDGKIYAAIEDNGYNNPYIAVYDAESLALLTYCRLPLGVTAQNEPIAEKTDVNPENGDIWMHKDGVPWVAVDHERNVFYTAEWSNAQYLNVFSLDDFSFVGLIPLTDADGNTAQLHRCQGADVYGGVLYASCDIGAEQPFVAVDPASGVMTHLFDRNLGDDAEAEGMCVQTRADGVYFVSQYYQGIKVGVCTYDVTDLVSAAETAKEPIELSFFERIAAMLRTVFIGIFNMLSPTLSKAF